MREEKKEPRAGFLSMVKENGNQKGKRKTEESARPISLHPTAGQKVVCSPGGLQCCGELLRATGWFPLINEARAVFC